MPFGFVSGDYVHEKIHCMDTQPNFPSEVLQMSHVNLMWVQGLALPSEFFHRTVAALVWSSNPTSLSCQILTFSWHPISHFSPAMTESVWQVIRHVSSVAHHMCPLQTTKSTGQLPSDGSLSTLRETDILTAAHTMNRFSDLTQCGRENICWVHAVTLSFLSVLS